jgi:ubiquinone/menaquinone biosynthesis C-methylase UbiE
MPMNIDPERTEVQYLYALADFKDRHILEVGCGNGRLTRRYAHHARRVTAFDPDWSSLKEALDIQSTTNRQTAAFTQADSEKLPFANQTFDGVILAWSL